MRNLITDLPGVLVGNAQDARAATGVTVAIFEHSVAAGVITSGGAPGSRAVTLREPEMGGLVDAIMANDGLSKALRPVHAPNDGDTVFAASTGPAGPGGDPTVLAELGTVAADCLARAVARGVYEATALPYNEALPGWETRFGGARA